MDLFKGIREKIDFRTDVRIEYERRVASKDKVLDIGGRNKKSRSNAKIRKLSTNPNTIIFSTDILDDYKPHIVDDICNSGIKTNSFDSIYCDAVIEHVQDYMGAISNMHRILKPGGELFVYVPFFYRFHDYMDYHRFTFLEVERMLRIFSSYKIFVPDATGYGGVLWQILSFYKIHHYPKIWKHLSNITNTILSVLLALLFLVKKHKETLKEVSWEDYKFYYTHLQINNGFCAWAVK